MEIIIYPMEIIDKVIIKEIITDGRIRTPLENRFYNSSEEYEEIDEEQLRLHHLDIISFLKENG